MSKAVFQDPLSFFSKEYSSKKRALDLIEGQGGQGPMLGGGGDRLNQFMQAKNEFDEVKTRVESDVNTDLERFNKRTGNNLGLNTFAMATRSPGRARPKQTYGVARQTLLGA